MKSAVELSVEEGIARITFDLPGEKVNKLSREVIARLSEVLTELEASAATCRGAILRSEKDGIFLAGADVAEIGAVATERDARAAVRAGQELMDRVEGLPFPVVAAIGGICLGGGSEIALACDGRVGSDHPRFQIGFPEVNLGILPAWGGTTRLPRLIGLAAACDLILTGRSIDARKAQKVGLLDRAVAHAELDRRALELLLELIEGRKPRRPRPSWLLEKNPFGRALLFSQVRKRVMEKTKGHYPAPLRALEVIRKGRGSRARSFELECEEASRLITSEISKNLVYLFFLNDAAKKSRGAGRKKLESAGLLGAGTMGGGIARLLASRDIPVRLKDVSPEALGAGLKAARAIFDGRVKRRRMASRELEKKMALITTTLDWRGFHSTDFVIEAIVEDMAIKKAVLRELEAEIPNDCIVATNTSTLSVTEMQSVLSHPGRMAGFHFFNPVDRMPLVEVIRGEATDEAVVSDLVSLAHRLGKTPVVVKDGPGFLVNRLLGPYLNEATTLLLETGDIAGIDRAFSRFGMPMGPLRLLDEVGIDVAQKAGAVLAKALGERAAPTPVLSKLVEAKRLGKKTGVGFYRHEGKNAQPDPGVAQLLGASSGTLDEEQALARGLGLMVAEAFRCLEEGIVASEGELDLAMVMGTGFPPFRGGLVRYARARGLARVVEELDRWREREGERFTVPETLRAAAV